MKDFNSEAATQQQEQRRFDTLALGAIWADVLVTGIVITGMWVDYGSATVALLSGVAFFLLFGSLVILTLSGALPAMVINGQNQKTTRQLHRLQYTAQMERAQRVEVVSHPQIEYTQPTEPMQLPDSPSFVPAVPPADEQLKLRCYTFVRDLFDEGGRPSPKRVLAEHTKSPGLVQYGKPKPDVVEYLVGLQMVWENERKQLFFNVRDYPTLRHCVTAIKLDTPAGRVEDTPSPSPHYTGEGGAV